MSATFWKMLQFAMGIQRSYQSCHPAQLSDQELELTNLQIC